MGPKTPPGGDGQPLLSEDAESTADGEAADPPRGPHARTLGRGSSSGSSRLRYSSLSRRSVYDPEIRDSEVAFTVVVKNDGAQDPGSCQNLGKAAVDVTHGAVNEAVQGAVQDVSRPDQGHFFACGQAVQDAVQEAVQEAIQQALEDNVRFDVRANFFTLIAITGVIIFWRGIWSLWDKLFGFSIWSELGSIGFGLAVMITFRLFGVPLLDGLPSG